MSSHKNCVSEAVFESFCENSGLKLDNIAKQIGDFHECIKIAAQRETNFVEKLVSMAKDVKGLRQELQDSQGRIAALEERVGNLEAELLLNSAPSPNAKARCDRGCNSPTRTVQPPEDSCEVLLTGLPPSLKESPSKIIQRILSFLSLSSALNHVLTTREWKPKSYKGSARAVAVKFASPHVRNEVLKAVHAMKNLNTKEIFSTENSLNFKVFDLLPKPAHLLLMQARKFSKAHDFSPPIVRNGIIYMRKSKLSTPIPIFTEHDLTSVNCVSQPATPK